MRGIYAILNLCGIKQEFDAKVVRTASNSISHRNSVSDRNDMENWRTQLVRGGVIENRERWKRSHGGLLKPRAAR